MVLGFNNALFYLVVESLLGSTPMQNLVLRMQVWCYGVMSIAFVECEPQSQLYFPPESDLITMAMIWLKMVKSVNKIDK